MIQITAEIIKLFCCYISLELPISIKTQNPAAKKNSINMFWESAFSITSSKERKQQHLKLIVFYFIFSLRSSYNVSFYVETITLYLFICCCLFRKKPFTCKMSHSEQNTVSLTWVCSCVKKQHCIA